MEARMLFVVLVLQLSLVALGGAAERCAQPGALRCEEGRHQSVCLARSRVWHRLSDCAASGGFCAQGRCVGGGEQRAARDACSSEYPKCSKDCTALEICYGDGVVTPINCGNGQLCDVREGTPQCVAASESKCTETFLCTVVGNIPDLTDVYVYYECSASGRNAERKVCTRNEGFFNPCSGSCDSTLQLGPKYEECDEDSPGKAFALLTNPSLYAVCTGGQLFWNKCENGYFDERIGICAGSSVYCNC